ncbi:pyrolysin [Ceratobasidium sp. AG-Ba]|nr:pyrolysin [Ceratobasidium sp. AG-Ba]
MDTLQKWMSSQTQLTASASDFLNNCHILRKEVAQTFQFPNQAVLNDTIAGVKSRIQSISVVEKCMQESRAVLNALLDTSTSHIPINKLPLELLSRIFSIAVVSSSCHIQAARIDALANIPLVCSRWYQVATNNSSLWSHIDLRVHSRSLPVKVWLNRIESRLERARGTLLHIHSEMFHRQFPRLAIPELIVTILPYISNIASLNLSPGNRNLTWALLSTYFESRDPSNLVRLAVSDLSVGEGGLIIPWSARPLPKLKFLELSGDGLGTKFNFSDISTILSGSPDLDTLCLGSLRFHHTSPPDRNAIISLPHLRILDLSQLHGEAFDDLLAMLHTNGLDLDVRLRSIGPDSPELRGFLLRSHVKSLTLCLNHIDDGTSIRHLFSSVPRLRALILIQSMYKDVLPMIHGPASGSLLPDLSFLFFSNYAISHNALAHIKQIVAERRLQYLVFSNCRFSESLNQHPLVEPGVSEGHKPEVEVQPLEEGPAVDQVMEDNSDQDDPDILFSPEDPEVHHKAMPEHLMNWFSGRAQNLVVTEMSVSDIRRLKPELVA